MFLRSLASVIFAWAAFGTANAVAEPLAPGNPTPVEGAEKPAEPAVQEKPAAKAGHRADAPSPACPKPVLPVYIADWGRLAELTGSDPEIAPKSKFWAKRHEDTMTIFAAGTIVGTGALLLGTVDRLTSDGWTKTGKWEVVGGAGGVLFTLFLSWLFDPDHDDFLTVVNHWNLRHPDRPLAPN
jgi:hypothetical protein